MNKRLFKKRVSAAGSFVLAMFFCILLLLLGSSSQRLYYLRYSLNVISSPIQIAVDYPIRIVSYIWQLFRDKTQLIRENANFRYKQLVFETQLQQLKQIENENAELKELLVASFKISERAIAAEILSVEMDNIRQVVVINKGKDAGVFVGQPVLDAKGLIGQVIDVGLLTSTVLLITDIKSAVPVRNNRTGERGIVIGTNYVTKLALINMPKSSLIKPGDQLVTSGLGRRYPEGYLVGQVVAVKQARGDDFLHVSVEPNAALNRFRMVLLTWPHEKQKKLLAELIDRQCFIDKL